MNIFYLSSPSLISEMSWVKRANWWIASTVQTQRLCPWMPPLIYFPRAINSLLLLHQSRKSNSTAINAVKPRVSTTKTTNSTPKPKMHIHSPILTLVLALLLVSPPSPRTCSSNLPLSPRKAKPCSYYGSYNGLPSLVRLHSPQEPPLSPRPFPFSLFVTINAYSNTDFDMDRWTETPTT